MKNESSNTETQEQNSTDSPGNKWSTLSELPQQETWQEHLEKADNKSSLSDRFESLSPSQPAIEANPDGTLTVTDKKIEIPKSSLENMDESQIMLVHSTNFFPNNHRILSNADGHKFISPRFSKDGQISDSRDKDKGYTERFIAKKQFISPRETVHFTLNGRVKDTGDGKGSWGNQKYIIIEPFEGHENEIARDSLAPFGSRNHWVHAGDNFTSRSVNLSKDAIILVREDVYNDLTEQQKEGCNIIKYSGNANICTKNLLQSLKLPVLENEANDASHAYSENYKQEMLLENRAEALKLACNADLDNKIDTFFLHEDDIASMLSILGQRSEIDGTASQEEVEKVANYYNISEKLARDIMTYGIYYNSAAQSFALTSNRDCIMHADSSMSHINRSLGNNAAMRAKMRELQSFIDNFSMEDYQEQQADLLEQNSNGFYNIPIGRLQSIKSFGILRKLQPVLDPTDTKTLVLRDDGLYMREACGDKEARYMSPEETKIADNSITIGEMIDNIHSQATQNRPD